ncbi:lipopolysaccharide assembly protein LapA domain-containing protein [Syntrophorhabdus aromaticivorans]|uniref:LapA family protein n=1 Tax=Syntrophorhabdus aromaticivorans TaxID=328301 RepID=A0A351U4M4_9BACT|nr:LapA family protein [Syntrophorhabdus aromaticivorans]NLW36095.1 LapA family protein [Syntrophorhabdus aromaticivorans]HBA54905.1 DUF1049 domain-containing protein [Syntrophorhabdus aromaticivorans]
MGIIVVILVIVLLVALFSVQNAAPVAISFLFWKFQASLAIVIFLCVLAGIAIGVTAMIVIGMKKTGRRKKASPGGSP